MYIVSGELFPEFSAGEAAKLNRLLAQEQLRKKYIFDVLSPVEDRDGKRANG